MRRKFFFFAPLALVAVVVFVTIGGLIVQALWNWLLPPLFGWREVTFWQALGLLALCRILFGGVGVRGRSRSGMRARMADRMADRMAARLDGMTPEERDRFRQRMRERWGWCAPSPPQGQGPSQATRTE